MKPFRLTLSLLVLIGCLSSVAQRAAAAVYCIDSPAALQTAVNTAQNTDEDNDFLLVQGNYALIASVSYNSPFRRAVSFRGGYAAGCNVLQRQLNASNTVIDGQSIAGRRFLAIGTRGVIVEGLTFKNLAGGSNSAVQLDGGVGGDAYVELRNSIVTGSSSNAPAVYIRALGGGLITNNLVYANTAPNAMYVDAVSPARRVVVSHNTVASNSAVGIGIAAGLSIPSILTSNVLWGNGGSDLKSDDYGVFALFNTIGSQSLQAPFRIGSTGNNAINPQLDASFHPTAASTSIVNTGSTLVAGITSLDLDGTARTVGSTPDRGAYEYTTNDYTGHTYTVSTTADSGAGSLRSAITLANAAGVPARITFNVGCAPAVITLTSVLPDIQVPLKIDGYSQAGSARNALANGFNGKLCIALLRGSTTGYALRVAIGSPAARLDVSGLVFSFFPGSAIALSDGTGHVIRGNSFGVQVPANGAYPGTGAVFGNGAAMSLSGNAFAATIGGPSSGDRNLIGNGVSPVGYGINLSQQINEWGMHTVQNNYIGVSADGLGDAGNVGDGVALYASGYDDISDNVIGNNGGSGISISGNQSSYPLYTVIQRNVIGENVAGIASGNTKAGVLIVGSSSNTVGSGKLSGDATTNGNVIGGNGGPGIWIDSINANPNTLSNSNFVAINDFDANGGLAIDLDALGPLANDPGDADGGANSGLNKPTMTSALIATPGVLEVAANFSGAASTYGAFFFYYSAACDASGVGPGSVYLGSATLSADNQGNANAVVRLKGSVAAGGVITATAAKSTETSEFGNCKTLQQDYLFQNGFDLPTP